MAVDKIKELLKEVIKTGDQELIELATELLKSSSQNNQEAAIVQSTSTKTSNNKYDDFTSAIKKGESPTRAIPVNETKRFNQFVDDKTEAIGEEFKTPNVQLTERKREPIKKVEQSCKKCGKTTMVHPTHKREWFYCEKCLGSMGRL